MKRYLCLLLLLLLVGCGSQSVLTDQTAITNQLQQDAQSSLTGNSITASYGGSARGVIFETTASERPLDFIQSECFNVQKTVWQDGQLQLSALDVALSTASGPTVYGECILTAQQAGTIEWNISDPQSAWTQYSSTTP